MRMSKNEKKLLVRILVSGGLFLILLPLHYRNALFSISEWYVAGVDVFNALEWVVFACAYAVIGKDVLFRAAHNITRGQVFDENFLMSVATLGACALGELAEAVAVMLFYQVGEMFQSYAVAKSRRSISELMDIRPDYANVFRDGNAVRVNPDEVAVGDTILVKPGERVPLDGVVTDGYSALDTSALTGESAPRDVAVGDSVISGCVNLSGILHVRVISEFEQSTAVKILELVETAADKKSKSESFITRFAKYYTPFVVFAAVALAFIPPLVTGQLMLVWVERALTFLVVSCPCALVISVPLSFFGGLGGASRRGVLVKGSNYLEQLAYADTIVFDKTGTLTKGNFAVSKVCAVSASESELIYLAAHAEHYSNHPIADSIKAAYGNEIDMCSLGKAEELAGFGMRAEVNKREILAGNARLMKEYGINYAEPPATGTAVHIAADGEYVGYILITDEIRPDAPRAIQELRDGGVKNIVMLTGDIGTVAQAVASELKLDEVYSELLPIDKVERVEKLLGGSSSKNKVVFVGDGINDAPVLAIADVGIAMGGIGSDAAIEAADVVIMTDEPSKIAEAMSIGKKTLSIVRQNIVFALTVKGAILALSGVGLASMWLAVFADVGVSVIAILNAMRAMRR